MKKTIALLILAVFAAALFCGCAQEEPIETDLGAFHYEQEFVRSVGDDTAADGNTFLVVRLTPADGTNVTLDEARAFFYDNNTQSVVDGVTYDLYCLAYEQTGGSNIRFALLFEVEDKGYEDSNEQPEVSLILG